LNIEVSLQRKLTNDVLCWYERVYLDTGIILIVSSAIDPDSREIEANSISPESSEESLPKVMSFEAPHI
jgi:hypothetical protein